MKAASRQSRLLLGSLVLLIALLAGVAWQAARSVVAHREIASAVLEDYARLAAEEFSRRAIIATGYYGYYAAMSRVNAEVDGDRGAIIALTEKDVSSVAAPARNVFALDVARREVAASSVPVSVAAVDFISSELATYAERDLPESGFEVAHAELDGRWTTFVFAWTSDGSMVYGFEVNREWLSDRFGQVLQEGPLLPAPLADGALSNDLLTVVVLDRGSEVLFRAARDSVPSWEAVTDLVMTDEYAGLFRGHTIRVAIDTELADDLIIGGLPYSRLPLIVVMLILAAVLLVTAVRQVRRENAIAAMRTDFVAEVSHELRTPLTQISMFTESLKLDRMRSSEDRERALSIIQRESKRLIHLVENILRFSGNGQADIPFRQRTLALAPIVSSVVDEFEPIAAASDTAIETRLDRDLEASVDPDALRQILINLLDNAIKYGPEGQTVVVTLRPVDDRARFEVDDQGPGIPESDRERIWADFVRLERDRNRATAGTGIGLAVVAELVARHGGTVCVEDGERGGARFVVELRS